MKKLLTALLTLGVCFGLLISTTACTLDFSDESAKDEFYTTVETVEQFNNALLAEKNIILGQDLELDTITIKEGVEIKLNLGGKTITSTLLEEGRHNYAIENYGSLTLLGEGNIVARGIKNFGNLTVEEGVTIEDIDQNGGAAIWNEGALTVNGGTFKALYEGSVTDNYGPGCLNNSGTAIINGGKFESLSYRTYAIISTGELTVNNASVTSNHGALAVSGGTATVNDGTFYASQHYGLYASNSTVDVNGGIFMGKRYSVDVYADTNSYITIDESAILANENATGAGSILFEKNIIAENAESAQTALDNAVEGTVIHLTENVSYGTLYIRQSQLSKSIDVSDWAGNGDVERFREVKGVSIVGANGATVDAIKVEAGMYTNENPHSNSATATHLNSYISIKGLTLLNITFTGNSDAITLTGKLGIDGFTVDGCSFTDNGDNRFIIKTSGSNGVYTDRNTNEVFLTQASKNITVKNCVIEGAKTAIELRETENVYILNNTFKNVLARDILLATNSGCYYTGVIEIVGNTSCGGQERFARISSIDANVLIANNTVTDWVSSEGDPDVVKFSSVSEGSVITLSENSWNGQNDDEAKASGLVNLG